MLDLDENTLEIANYERYEKGERKDERIYKKIP